MNSNDFEFTNHCNVCGCDDNTVWEVVQGIALCEPHQEEWFKSRKPVTRWVEQKIVDLAAEYSKGLERLRNRG